MSALPMRFDGQAVLSGSRRIEPMLLVALELNELLGVGLQQADARVAGDLPGERRSMEFARDHERACEPSIPRWQSTLQ